MKKKRNWSNSEMRSLTRGEAMHHTQEENIIMSIEIGMYGS